MGLEDYFEHGIARGVVRYAREQRDWRLFGPGWMFSSLTSLRSWRGDGIIARIESTQSADLLESLSLPVIDVAGAYSRPGFRYVGADDRAIGRSAGSYFASLGFRSFAYAGVKGVRWSEERLAGFTDETGRPKAQFLRSLDWYEKRENEEDLKRFLGSLEKPTALFACNDTVGLRVINACGYAGIKVPEEVAVLGVDNEDIPCELAAPPLSSIPLPLEEIGYRAAESLHRLVSGRTLPRRLLFSPGNPVLRESSRIFAYADPLVTAALKRIRGGEPLQSVSELSELLNVSRRSLEVHFKSATGKTLHQEIIESRIALALHLLTHEDLKVSAVAESTGFRSVQRFYAVFKEHTGATPAEYREQSKGSLKNNPPG